MWTILVALALVGATVQAHEYPRRVRRYTQLEWEDCGSENASLRIHEMRISPMPIQVPGNVKISIDAESTREFAGAHMELLIRRETWIGTITLPCIDHIGSCSYRDSCTLMDRMEAENWGGIGEEIASQMKEMFNYSAEDVCPVKPYRMAIHDYTMEIPPMPSVLGFLAQGDYEFSGRLTEKGTEAELGCFKLRMSMTKAEEPCTGWLCRRRRKRRHARARHFEN